MQSRMFEITFVGQAGPVVRAEFDDCGVSVGPGTTTLYSGLLVKAPCTDCCSELAVLASSSSTCASRRQARTESRRQARNESRRQARNESRRQARD